MVYHAWLIWLLVATAAAIGLVALFGGNYLDVVVAGLAVFGLLVVATLPWR